MSVMQAIRVTSGEAADVLQARTDPARRVDFGLLLIWASAMFVIVTVYAADADLRLARPAVLLPACLWLLLPTRRAVVAHVQAAVFLYLIWIFIVSAFDVFWTCPASGDCVRRISMTVPAVVLMFGGLVLRKILRSSSPPGRLPIERVLFLTVIVIGGHVFFLWILLRRIYGYGWEEDGAVFGRIGLLAIVLTGMVPVAYSSAMRGSLALAAAIILSMRSFA